MFTPQEVSEKTFPKTSALTAGYNMAAVDEFLDPLTEDYTALYKENAALKEKVDELEAQAKLQAAQAQQAARLESDLDNTKRAMDWFWQIDEAYVSGKTRLCRSLIQNLEDAGLRAFLPTESTTDNGRFSPADRYQEIYDALF